MQSLPDRSESNDDAWERMAPLIDAALAQLGGKDRAALVLRFFEGQSFRDLGAALGTSEDAAKMRVGRALEKLRKLFDRQGLALPAATIATAAMANSAQAAPAALATSLSMIAATKGAAASGSAPSIAKAAAKLMAWTKLKTAAATAFAAAVVIAGAIVTAAKIYGTLHPEAWRTIPENFFMFAAVPPQVRILPTKFDHSAGIMSRDGDSADPQVMGSGASIETIIYEAYHTNPVRTLLPAGLPPGRYDFIAKLPRHSLERLQKALADQFGLAGRREMRERDVFILRQKRPNAPGLKPANPMSPGWGRNDEWSFVAHNESFAAFAAYLEAQLNTPVIDESGLSGRYDIDLKWHVGSSGPADAARLRQALLDELGLELVPTRRKVEMVVVRHRS